MSHPISRRDILLNTIIVEGGLVVAACLLAWLLGPALFTQFHLTGEGVLWGCLGAVPPLIIILLIDRFPIGPFRHVADISDQFLRPLLRPCKWPDYFLLSALAGFCEELFFRGWLQPGLAQWMPMWLSIVLGGLVFALCHLITPAYFIIAWLISLYLAMLLVWTDNLLVPMVTHGVYDLIAIFAVMLGGKAEKPISWDVVDTEVMQPDVTSEPRPGEPLPSSADMAPGTDA